MMTLLSRCRGSRLVAAAVVIAVAGATAGAATALLMGGDAGPPLASQDVSAHAGPGGEPQIVAADPAVEFPRALADLPNPPSHLAVDPSTGDLWFMVFAYGGVSNTLYHYSPANGNVETFAIPRSNGSELYSAIGVNARGHIIFAEGSVVTDFDPGTAKFTQTDIGEPQTATVPYSPPDGTQILDMALGEGRIVYLSRINVPAVTEFDLATGKKREIPYPSSFGPAYDIELSGATLWMTSRWGIEGISEPQTGWIDLATGAFTAAGPGMTALARSADGRLFGIQANTAMSMAVLGWVTDKGLTPLIFASDADKALATGGLGLFDYVAVNQRGDVAWVAGWGSESIARIDTRTGAVHAYKLPVYETSLSFAPRCPAALANLPSPSPDPCLAIRRLNTQVRGLAVAPNGDVYFSDATLNRVGIIHAGS